MSLELWRRNGWLVSNDTVPAEIAELFAVVDRELSDATSQGLSVDGKFMHAYDAGLILCMIPLRACGYRVAKGSGHHKRAIESLPLSMGADFRQVSDQIEVASRKRGQAMYDHVDVVEERDADALIETVKRLRTAVSEFLTNNYPELLLSTR
ncbi:hypothetical protein [Fuerstiella marisgermanici]|uniref:HEPN domain-containing protein n=1 Tax=Fuerstiella marisgermanici TaxID=1891926 RepID=A0A1P8WBY1_9PLAN|nr:hypothetical protein [Fuerstiella marisgermanici]APZ91546.1 hypothetical protein Fuma_01134 [Fuerstiella marisgermanici]